MIVELFAALALQQATPTDLSIRDTIDALPDRDGQRAWQYTGAEDAYSAIWFAAYDYWLHPHRMGGRYYFVRYTARPTFGQGGFRQVVFRRHRAEWDPDTQRYAVDYTYAQRLIYENADLMEAFGRAFPLESVLRAMGRSDRIDPNWALERREYYPDVQTVVRAVRVRREILDEQSCPAMGRALERLNLLETPPIHIRGFGPDRRPAADLDDGRIVVTGDGTGFDLEILFQRGPEGHSHSLTLNGNHGSIPGDWIERFEAETAGCWRPDDGSIR